MRSEWVVFVTLTIPTWICLVLIAWILVWPDGAVAQFMSDLVMNLFVR